MKCISCNEDINGKYWTKENEIFCERCYEKIRLKCGICNENIKGKYIINHNINVCAICDATYSNCDACNRHLSPLTDGGYSISDGRKVCSICYKSIVDDNDKLNDYFNKMSRFMRKIGFRISNYDKLSMRLAPSHDIDESRGICLYESTTTNGVVTKREFTIKVLFGLPELSFEGILAHELFHMWVKINTSNNLTKFQEEGVANLCQYLYVLHIGNTTKDENNKFLSKHIIDNMMQNNDINYGAGFRKAKDIYESHGIEGIMHYIGLR